MKDSPARIYARKTKICNTFSHVWYIVHDIKEKIF